jgi:hypothetical protein
MPAAGRLQKGLGCEGREGRDCSDVRCGPSEREDTDHPAAPLHFPPDSRHRRTHLPASARGFFPHGREKYPVVRSAPRYPAVFHVRRAPQSLPPASKRIDHMRRPSLSTKSGVSRMICWAKCSNCSLLRVHRRPTLRKSSASFEPHGASCAASCIPASSAWRTCCSYLPTTMSGGAYRQHYRHPRVGVVLQHRRKTAQCARAVRGGHREHSSFRHIYGHRCGTAGRCDSRSHA